MNFPPILILAIIWIIMGLASSKKRKAQQQQQASRNAKPGAAAPGAAKQQAKTPESKPAPKPPVETPFRPAVMQPMITVTEHDDTVYQGSMYAETGEGYDPCHDEQLAPLTAVETAVPAAETTVPGLQLSWNGDEIVRGIVVSEILKRK